jgi:hypothetical protein
MSPQLAQHDRQDQAKLARRLLLTASLVVVVTFAEQLFQKLDCHDTVDKFRVLFFRMVVVVCALWPFSTSLFPKIRKF